MNEQQSTDEENAWITHELHQQQQYRVIADRDKGDDPQWGMVNVGDRVTIGAPILAGVLIGTPARIERPVLTTDETATSSVHDMRGSREVPVAPHPPTRDQIAALLYRAEYADVPNLDPWEAVGEHGRTSYLAMADAMLALLEEVNRAEA